MDSAIENQIEGEREKEFLEDFFSAEEKRMPGQRFLRKMLRPKEIIPRKRLFRRKT